MLKATEQGTLRYIFSLAAIVIISGSLFTCAQGSSQGGVGSGDYPSRDGASVTKIIPEEYKLINVAAKFADPNENVLLAIPSSQDSIVVRWSDQQNSLGLQEGQPLGDSCYQIAEIGPDGNELGVVALNASGPGAPSGTQDCSKPFGTIVPFATIFSHFNGSAIRPNEKVLLKLKIRLNHVTADAKTTFGYCMQDDFPTYNVSSETRKDCTVPGIGGTYVTAAARNNGQLFYRGFGSVQYLKQQELLIFRNLLLTQSNDNIQIQTTITYNLAEKSVRFLSPELDLTLTSASAMKAIQATLDYTEFTLRAMSLKGVLDGTSPLEAMFRTCRAQSNFDCLAPFLAGLFLEDELKYSLSVSKEFVLNGSMRELRDNLTACESLKNPDGTYKYKCEDINSPRYAMIRSMVLDGKKDLTETDLGNISALTLTDKINAASASFELQFFLGLRNQTSAVLSRQYAMLIAFPQGSVWGSGSALKLNDGGRAYAAPVAFLFSAAISFVTNVVIPQVINFVVTTIQNKIIEEVTKNIPIINQVVEAIQKIENLKNTISQTMNQVSNFVDQVKSFKFDATIQANLPKINVDTALSNIAPPTLNIDGINVKMPPVNLNLGFNVDAGNLDLQNSNVALTCGDSSGTVGGAIGTMSVQDSATGVIRSPFLVKSTATSPGGFSTMSSGESCELAKPVVDVSFEPPKVSSEAKVSAQAWEKVGEYTQKFYLQDAKAFYDVLCKADWGNRYTLDPDQQRVALNSGRLSLIPGGIKFGQPSFTKMTKDEKWLEGANQNYNGLPLVKSKWIARNANLWYWKLDKLKDTSSGNIADDTLYINFNSPEVRSICSVYTSSRNNPVEFNLFLANSPFEKAENTAGVPLPLRKIVLPYLQAQYGGALTFNSLFLKPNADKKFYDQFAITTESISATLPDWRIGSSYRDPLFQPPYDAHAQGSGFDISFFSNRIPVNFCSDGTKLRLVFQAAVAVLAAGQGNIRFGLENPVDENGNPGDHIHIDNINIADGTIQIFNWESTSTAKACDIQMETFAKACKNLTLNWSAPYSDGKSHRYLTVDKQSDCSAPGSTVTTQTISGNMSTQSVATPTPPLIETENLTFRAREVTKDADYQVVQNGDPNFCAVDGKCGHVGAVCPSSYGPNNVIILPTRFYAYYEKAIEIPLPKSGVLPIRVSWNGVQHVSDMFPCNISHISRQPGCDSNFSGIQGDCHNHESQNSRCEVVLSKQYDSDGNLLSLAPRVLTIGDFEINSATTSKIEITFKRWNDVTQGGGRYTSVGTSGTDYLVPRIAIGKAATEPYEYQISVKKSGTKEGFFAQLPKAGEFGILDKIAKPYIYDSLTQYRDAPIYFLSSPNDSVYKEPYCYYFKTDANFMYALVKPKTGDFCE